MQHSLGAEANTPAIDILWWGGDLLSVNKGNIIRSLVVIALVFASYQAVWWTIQFEGEYTNGKPTPATIKGVITQDAEEESTSVEINKATSFIIYLLERDDIDKQNQSTPQHDDSRQHDFAKLAEITIYLLMGSIILISFSKNILNKKLWLLMFIGTWVGGLILFSLIGPMTTIADHSPNSNRGVAPIEGSNPEGGQFAHMDSETKMGFDLGGPVVYFEISGFDLGLVDEENRSSVSHSKPKPGEIGYDSYIEFEGELRTESGFAIVPWLILPFVWFKPIKQLSLEEE